MGGLLCSYPDGNTCDIAQTLRGTCRVSLSYCARHGYTPLVETCSVGQVVGCEFPDGSVCWDGSFADGTCGPCVPGRDDGCAAVWLSSDQATYTGTDPITVTLHNDTALPVYVHPCGSQRLERLESDDTWELVPVDAVCNLATLPWQELAAGAPLDQPATMPENLHAIYRVGTTVGFGCDTSVPYLEASCERTETIFTEPFMHRLP